MRFEKCVEALKNQQEDKGGTTATQSCEEGYNLKKCHIEAEEE